MFAATWTFGAMIKLESDRYEYDLFLRERISLADPSDDLPSIMNIRRALIT